MMLILAKEFHEQGYSVDLVLAKRSGHLRSQVPKGIEVFDLQKAATPTAVGRLVRYLVRRQPIALISAMPTANSAAALACRIAPTRTIAIISERNTRSVALGNVNHVRLKRRVYSALLHMLCRICYPLSDLIVCISPGVAEEVAARYPTLLNRIRIIPNPANPPIPKHVSQGASIDIHPWLDDADTLCAVAVGRLVEQKDYRTLLAALAQAREQTDLHLIIVGDGPQRAELQDLASRLGVEDAVEFVGFRHDRLEFIRRADVFVMTSKHEGFGNVLVEALSVGARIVATDCKTGPRLILLNGELGYLVPVGDASAVATALQRALVESLGDPLAKRRRASDFSPNAISERYLDEMKRIW